MQMSADQASRSVGWQAPAVPSNDPSSLSALTCSTPGGDYTQLIWLLQQQQQLLQQQQQQLACQAGASSLYLVPASHILAAANSASAPVYPAGYPSAYPASTTPAHPTSQTVDPGAAAWGYQADGTDYPQPATPYYGMSYGRPTGFWLQGFFFASYEHFIAYRRTAIAYNFHFFGIRPPFRPPAHLPRPRPPSAAQRGTQARAADSHLAGPVTDNNTSATAAAASSASSLGLPESPSGPRPGHVTAAAPAADLPPSPTASVAPASPQVPVPSSPRRPNWAAGDMVMSGSPSGLGCTAEEPESLCCSPGGCSTCDSDDTASDAARSDTAAAEDILVEDMHHSPAALFADEIAVEGYELGLLDDGPSADAGASGSMTAKAAGAGGLTLAAREEVRCVAGAASSLGTPAAVQEGQPGAIAGTVHVPAERAWATPDKAAGGLGAPELRLAVAAAHAGSPAGLRASGGDQAQERGELYAGICWGAGCVAGPGSPACACPPWLEPHLEDLLGAVVGEALWGPCDDASF